MAHRRHTAVQNTCKTVCPNCILKSLLGWSSDCSVTNTCQSSKYELGITDHWPFLYYSVLLKFTKITAGGSVASCRSSYSCQTYQNKAIDHPASDVQLICQFKRELKTTKCLCAVLAVNCKKVTS